MFRFSFEDLLFEPASKSLGLRSTLERSQAIQYRHVWTAPCGYVHKVTWSPVFPHRHAQANRLLRRRDYQAGENSDSNQNLQAIYD